MTTEFDYAHARDIAHQHQWSHGLRDYQVDVVMRALADAGVQLEDGRMPDIDTLTDQQRYLFLRQLLDAGKASWRRDARVDVIPGTPAGVRQRVAVDVMLITYDGRDYLVQASNAAGEVGRAVPDVGEGRLPATRAARVGYLAAGVVLAAHNTWARLRFAVSGPQGGA